MNRKGIVLVVDDSAFTRSMIEKSLSGEGLTIVPVPSAEEAFAWLAQHSPDLILLDLVLPKVNGYEICAEIKGRPELADVPVIFLTATKDEDSILKGFQAGALDYITKPFRIPELQARVRTHLKNKLTADELRIANRKLEHAMAELRLQGMKDPLTGLFNRRYFIESMAEWKTTFQMDETFIVLIDLDDFKLVNDTYGHCTGDYILYTVADTMARCIGENGAAGRWGGDEFLLMLCKMDAQQACEIVGRIVKEIDEFNFCYDDNHLHCHITAGIARFDPNRAIEQTIELADDALYRAKEEGKNRFAFYDNT